jgi:hypothetical protein
MNPFWLGHNQEIICPNCSERVALSTGYAFQPCTHSVCSKCFLNAKPSILDGEYHCPVCKQVAVTGISIPTAFYQYSVNFASLDNRQDVEKTPVLKPTISKSIPKPPPFKLESSDI